MRGIGGLPGSFNTAFANPTVLVCSIPLVLVFRGRFHRFFWLITTCGRFGCNPVLIGKTGARRAMRR